jgi:hypothetical protein
MYVVLHYIYIQLSRWVYDNLVNMIVIIEAMICACEDMGVSVKRRRRDTRYLSLIRRRGI